MQEGLREGKGKGTEKEKGKRKRRMQAKWVNREGNGKAKGERGRG